MNKRKHKTLFQDAPFIIEQKGLRPQPVLQLPLPEYPVMIEVERNEEKTSERGVWTIEI